MSVAAGTMASPAEDEGGIVGAWGFGPFDNDESGDFVDYLDKTAEEDRLGLVRATLTEAADATDYVTLGIDSPAVACAALIASQCPEGEPLDENWFPDLPDLTGLHELAVRALDRVIAKDSELRELWDASPNGAAWRAEIARLREALLSH